MVIFIDDLCCWDNDLETHVQHLEIILSTLRRHQLYIKEPKSGAKKNKPPSTPSSTC
jgi:hypothetical protein